MQQILLLHAGDLIFMPLILSTHTYIYMYQVWCESESIQNKKKGGDRAGKKKKTLRLQIDHIPSIFIILIKN